MLHYSLVMMYQQILNHTEYVHRRVGKVLKPMLAPVCCRKLIISEKKTMLINTVEALVSGHPRDAKKVFTTGTGRLREWFAYAATRGERVKWPFKGACPAIHKN